MIAEPHQTPLPHASDRRSWLWGAGLVLVVLLVGVASGFQEARSSAAIGESLHLDAVLSRSARILCLTGLSMSIVLSGHRKLEWQGGVLMLWQWVDLLDRDLTLSPVLILPFVFSVAALIAGRRGHTGIAAAAIALSGAILTLVFVDARLTGF